MRSFILIHTSLQESVGKTNLGEHGSEFNLLGCQIAHKRKLKLEL